MVVFVLRISGANELPCVLIRIYTVDCFVFYTADCFVSLLVLFLLVQPIFLFIQLLVFFIYTVYCFLICTVNFYIEYS